MKAPTLHAILTAKPNPPRWLARLARPLGIPLIILSVIGIYGLVAGRVVLNGSDSMAANGFYVLVWPRPLIRGAIVVADPPERFARKFEGLLFTKRLVGLPGDAVTHRGSAVCINDACFEQGTKEGQPFGTLAAEGVVPDGHVAIFGETSTSLDSRYAEIGYFPIETIRAVGFAIPGFPAWEALAERIGS